MLPGVKVHQARAPAQIAKTLLDGATEHFKQCKDIECVYTPCAVLENTTIAAQVLVEMSFLAKKYPELKILKSSHKDLKTGHCILETDFMKN